MDTESDGALAEDAEFKAPVDGHDGERQDVGLSGARRRGVMAAAEALIAAALPAGRNRRRWIIGGSVATGALLGGVAFVLSPAPPAAPSRVVSHPASQVKPGFVGINAAPLLAPAATLAAAPVGEGHGGPAKPPVAVISSDAAVAEVRGLKATGGATAGANAQPSGAAGTSGSSSAAATPSATVAPVSVEPLPSAAGLNSPTGPASSASVPAAEVGVTPAPPAPKGLTPQMPTPLSVGAPVMASAPSAAPVAAAAAEPSVAAAAPGARSQDAAEQAAALQAAPMTDAQQVQVLDLVTELGRLVRDVKADMASLRKEQERLGQTTTEELGDLSRRLSLAEAHWAVSAAMLDADHPSTQAHAPRPVSVGGTAPGATSSATAVAHHYRVQAASPGLAMLAEDTPAGVEQRQVAVGDVVPGYGRISRIAQKGAGWVVVTDGGTIE